MTQGPFLSGLRAGLSALALTAIPLTLPVPSQAQAAQTERSFDFSIPAQPLLGALADFTAATGIQVIYASAQSLTSSAPALGGRLTARDALARLLAGSGLSARFTGDATAILEKASADLGTLMLDPVTIEGQSASGTSRAEIGTPPPAYGGGQVARGARLGMLGNRDFMDTPFNQTAYTAQAIANQQARSIADVAANDPSVRASWPSTGYSAPLMIRGFAASNQDVAFGGLYGIMPTMTVAVETAERVEILKGPSTLLTSMSPQGSVGGAINVVPKRAEDGPITRVTASYLSDAQFGVHTDLGRRYGAAKEYGVRFNAVHRDGDTPVDDQSQQFSAGALGLDYRGERLRLSLDLGQQRQYSTAPSLITYVGPGLPIPTAPDTSSNWFQDWSWVDLEDTYGAIRAELDISKDWNVYVAGGGKNTDFDRLTYFPSVTNASGALSATPARMTYRYLTNTQEAGLRGKARTGAVDHQISIGATRYYQDTRGQSVSQGSALLSNLYNPVSSPRPGTTSFTPPKISDTTLTSYAVGDVLSFLDERVQVIGGVRLQDILVHNYSATTGQQTSRYGETKLTPAVGLVVKPWGNVSVYGNYVEGLQQGAVVGATYANAGEVLAPYVSKQYEAGIKVDWGGFATSLALFQITQPSGGAPSSTGTYSVTGEQRNRGLELNTFGEITPGLRLLGGLSLMDATITKSATAATLDKEATGVPQIQVNLGAEWDTPLVPALTLFGRVIHTGEQQVDAANTQQLPSWTRFDLGARYTIETEGTPVTLRANVENVFNTNYWASSAYGAGWLSMGAPRTFLLSTSFDF